MSTIIENLGGDAAYDPTRYGLLKTIDEPSQLRSLDRRQLGQLADELRAYVLESVSKTGGHLSSNLGTVELTIALHYIFQTPEDRIVWDVGHQTYPHKILTGRREAMARLRMLDGISGFPRRTESKYDTFGTAHSSTSISAALGMAVGRQLQDEERHCLAPIRHRAFVDFDLRRPRHGGRRQAEEREAPLHRRDRRRRDVGRHGVRGHEQRRRDGRRSPRDPQRQRDVDLAAGGRADQLPRAPAV